MHVEVSASIGAMIVNVAAARGASAAQLTERTGFDPKLAEDPDASIPLELETRLWNEAALAVGDETFGLHAAELVRPGAFDVMDYAVRTAPTLRVSLERLVRYNRLVHDVAEFTVIERPPRLRIEHAFRVKGVAPCRHAAEFTIAAVLRIGEQLTGSALPARAVELAHPPPTSPETQAEVARFFGVAPRFSAPRNALELDAAVADRPLPGADPTLWRVMQRHADALLSARARTGGTTSDRVRELLATSLGEGASSLASVAATLKCSARSLQRRLADEGTTFDALLDDLRRDLALRYLADRKLAIGEVAYLLGYSEPSPFHRAFRRWTGLTPSEARRRAA